MDADDLGRMLGWEFSLMIATIRIINSGLLDDLPDLKIQFSHFSGGIGRYLGRIRGFQQRDQWGTAAVPRPRPPAEAAGRSLSRQSAVLRLRRLGRARSVRADSAPTGCASACRSWRCRRCVFATDYPQAVRDPSEVADYVDGGATCSTPMPRAMVHGLNAEKLIPDLRERLARRKP